MKICSLYGAGFYYIPGTDTCIKIGGYVRAEWNYQANGSFNPVRVYNFDNPGRDREVSRSRGGITVDVRSQTAYGTLRGYAVILPTHSNDGATATAANGGSPYSTLFSPAVFIQFAGFTFGKTASFFDFDTMGYSNQTNVWGGSQAGNGIHVLAYTAQFGNGLSLGISAENTESRRSAIHNAAFTQAGATLGVAPGAVTVDGYGGRRWPDLVAHLRIDQAWGSAQIMAAVHDVYSNAGVGVTASETGWAIGAGLRWNLPMIGAGDYIIAQVAYSEGATNYVGSSFGTGGQAFSLQEGFPVVTNTASGLVFDGVIVGANTLDLTTGWSVTGGFEHRWNPQWKTSLYGSYGEINYSAAASAALAAAYGVAGSASADWSLWQVGSRTVWTPVQNLDLSVDILYTDLNESSFDGGTSGGALLGGKGYVAGIFRAQRNFWP